MAIEATEAQTPESLQTNEAERSLGPIAIAQLVFLDAVGEYDAAKRDKFIKRHYDLWRAACGAIGLSAVQQLEPAELVAFTGSVIESTTEQDGKLPPSAVRMMSHLLGDTDAVISKKAKENKFKRPQFVASERADLISKMGQWVRGNFQTAEAASDVFLTFYRQRQLEVPEVLDDEPVPETPEDIVQEEVKPEPTTVAEPLVVELAPPVSEAAPAASKEDIPPPRENKPTAAPRSPRARGLGSIRFDATSSIESEEEDESSQRPEDLMDLLFPDQVEATDEGQPELQKDENYDSNGDPKPKLGQEGVSDLVRLYLREIGKVPLLDAAQEVELSKRIEAGLAAEKILAGTFEPSFSISVRELKELARDGEEAKKQMISANLRLVVSIAKKYSGRGMDLLDVIGHGNMGLIRGVEKFDYKQGNKFSTYASWWIKQAIGRAIADEGRAIRIPVHLVEQINRMRKAEMALQQALGREPEPDEIAQYMDIDVEKVHSMISMRPQPVSLETRVGDDDESVLGDFIADGDAVDPGSAANFAMMTETVRGVLHSLGKREREVIEMRYGLKDGRQQTLAEVGAKLGLTRERIRQIEKETLRKMKSGVLGRELKDYYLEESA